MQTNLTSLNQEIRKKIRELRCSLPIEQRLKGEDSVYQQIKQHPKIASAKNISIFLSFDGELNTQPIISYLWQQNKSVFLPIVDPTNTKKLIFIQYDQNTSLIKNKFGILEPELNPNKVISYQQLDVILTPLVAFDHRNYRIGMGGGYYDRLLENYQQHNIYPIGLAFKCQQVEHIPNQPWDIQLPEIICG